VLYFFRVFVSLFFSWGVSCVGAAFALVETTAAPSSLDMVPFKKAADGTRGSPLPQFASGEEVRAAELITAGYSPPFSGSLEAW
jgi:hypothetical protein